MGQDDPLASAKAFLHKPSVVPKRKVDTTRDIELPNDTGEVDPRLSKPVSRPVRKSEQPKDMVSNIALRRSLTGGRR